VTRNLAAALLCPLLLLSFAQMSRAENATETHDALFVARHLDVLSFPNSIHPRSRPDAFTLMDYGFTHFKSIPHGVESDEDSGDWYFSVVIEADHGDTMTLCVTDKALNGGSYNARSRVKVKMDSDGLFHATERPLEGSSC
jgi:hypothetical protein